MSDNNGGWIQADLTPEREPDALDREIMKIAKVIKMINVEAIAVGKKYPAKLREEFIECIDLSKELHEEDRDYVIEVITEGLLEGSLVELLRDMIAERKKSDGKDKKKRNN